MMLVGILGFAVVIRRKMNEPQRPRATERPTPAARALQRLETTGFAEDESHGLAQNGWRLLGPRPATADTRIAHLVRPCRNVGGPMQPPRNLDPVFEGLPCKVD